MQRIGDGMYSCGLHRWLDDTPEPEPVEEKENWRPAGLSLSYVPGTVKGGGSDRASGKSPAMQKYESWMRRQRGVNIMRIRIEPTIKRPEK